MSNPEIQAPPVGATVPNPLNPGQTVYTFSPIAGAPGGVAVDSTSLQSGEYLNTLQMNRIFDLLLRMIDVLQKVAVSQAEQLKFLNSWQRAYIDKMSEVHTFVGKNSDASYISGSDTDSGTARQDLNQTNTTYTEQMRSSGQIAGDTAKAMQANISQTQDAVNQQSNMATSIIQQMNTILASIFR